MRIRPAQLADFEAYCDLVRELDLLHSENAPRYYQEPGNPPRPRAFFESLLKDSKKAILCAEDDGKILGYVHLELRAQADIPVLVPMTWTNISDLVVGKAFQRRGVGRALMARARTWAKEKGTSELSLSVSKFNEVARQFYRKEGFQLKHEVLAMELS